MNLLKTLLLGAFGWVRLCAFGELWVLLGAFGFFWVLLGTFGYFWVLWVLAETGKLKLTIASIDHNLVLFYLKIVSQMTLNGLKHILAIFFGVFTLWSEMSNPFLKASLNCMFNVYVLLFTVSCHSKCKNGAVCLGSLVFIRWI